MKLAWVGLVVGIAACSKSEPPTVAPPSRPAPGTERGDCIAATGVEHDETAVGTCAPGLWCLSNLCVRPPPADCQALADQLTSFDLGNYAEPEERAPVVATYKKACVKAMVSKEQGECVAKATDKFSAYQCAPLMFPEMMKTGDQGDADCSTIGEKMRSLLDRSMGAQNDPNMAKMAVGIVQAVKASCAEDKWPVPLKQCILTAGNTADNADAMAKCNSLMPPDIQQKLTERMMKIMQSQPATPSNPQPPSQ